MFLNRLRRLYQKLSYNIQFAYYGWRLNRLKKKVPFLEDIKNKYFLSRKLPILDAEEVITGKEYSVTDINPQGVINAQTMFLLHANPTQCILLASGYGLHPEGKYVHLDSNSYDKIWGFRYVS